jgi:adenylate kinase family enzyme
MPEMTLSAPNTLFIEVMGAGLPEVDGLYVPSTAPPAESVSGTLSSVGYWNGRMAWDRADGKSARRPALSYSNSYRSWRIGRLDGHLAYHITCDDDLPPTDRPWEVYKLGIAPAPAVSVYHVDPRLPCPPPRVIFVLGGPGAGKGTMCELAELRLGWTHLSVGELLRRQVHTGGPAAEALRACLAAGHLVPDALVVSLLRAEMERLTRTTGQGHFLLDGFPRSLGNLQAWVAAWGDRAELPKLVYFSCPLPVLQQRVMGRAKYSGRSDDNLQSLQQRFETYQAETLPTVQTFRQAGRCIDIDTSQSRAKVYDQLKVALTESRLTPFAEQPPNTRAEILLGLRPYPPQSTAPAADGVADATQ